MTIDPIEMARRYLDGALSTRDLHRWARARESWPAPWPPQIPVPGSQLHPSATESIVRGKVEDGVATALVGGMDLQSSWSAHVAELAPLVLQKWVALLVEAAELRGKVAAQQVVIRDSRHAHERAAAAASASMTETLAEYGAWQDAAHAREADLRAQLAAAQADAAQARQEALDASRDRDAARGQAEAWRTTATAVQDALHTLRAALRIPSPGDDAGLVLRGKA